MHNSEVDGDEDLTVGRLEGSNGATVEQVGGCVSFRPGRQVGFVDTKRDI